MQLKRLKQMLMVFIVTTLALTSISAPGHAQQELQPEQRRQQELQQRDAQRRQQELQRRDAQQHQQELQTQEQRFSQQRETQQRQQDQYRQAQQERVLQDRHFPPPQRLSEQRQHQLIREQQQRLVQYRQHLELQQQRAQQQIALLQEQHRLAQARFAQAYRERLHQQYLRLRDQREYDYEADPSFSTPPSYRYYRDGSYYDITAYGAEVLRHAVNAGYEEGLRAGQADREDGWSCDYRESYAYQDAHYGYEEYYVSPEEYQHYFRAGFRDGYEDGYNDNSAYGTYANGRYTILSSILSQILNLEPLS